jgi:hypothetical protein
VRKPVRAAAVAARYLGAAALLGVGLDHLEQFSAGHYSAIPTMGTLFALNFVSAALTAGALAAPVQRLPGRAGRIALPLLSAGGIGVAAGSLAGLLLSESTGLFGFMEVGYRPAIVLSIALELATIVLLTVHALMADRGFADRARPEDARGAPARSANDRQDDRRDADACVDVRRPASGSRASSSSSSAPLTPSPPSPRPGRR